MQKAILPLRYIGVSQPMNGKTSHIGLKAIDFGWNSQHLKESTELLAPFDGKVVWKSGSSKCIAFESTNKVEFSNGLIDYMTVITAHDNNAPDVGQTFKQGEVYSHSGTAGGVPKHCHLEVQRGSFRLPTTVKNTSYDGKYNSYIFPNTIEPTKALFVKDDVVYSQKEGCNPYKWKKVSDMGELIKIIKDKDYDYKWSVDGNKYGENYEVTIQQGFADLNLEKEGWERILKVNGGLFYEYEGKHYANGLEKSRGVNNQDVSMTAVSDYNKCMAIACVNDELYFASQEWIIKNKLDAAYGALTGMGLILAGKVRDDMHDKFNNQWNCISGRTVIGEDKDGNFMSYSFPGVTGQSGLTGKQVQAKCMELGFYNAIMLDGGGSVFREYLGRYKISTTRKVKNALILYRKKKAVKEEPIEPSVDYKELYEQALAKNDQLSEELKTMTDNYNTIEKDFTQLNMACDTLAKQNEILSETLRKVKELVNGL